MNDLNKLVGRARFLFEIRSPWLRYGVAVAGVLFSWALSRQLSHPSPFLFGFLAVILASGLAGPGPAVLSTGLATLWCWVVLRDHAPVSESGLWLRCVLFALECLFLCACGERLRRAIDKAATSETWHRSLVETAAEGIWVISAEGLITFANPRIGELLGVPCLSLPGRRLDDFLFPEDRPAEANRLRNHRPAVRQQFDRRLRREGGVELWVLACTSVLPHGPGGAGVLCMMTDITERKQAELSLRRSEQRFRSLFDNIVEGVYQTTPDGRILAANPTLLRMLGLRSEAELSEVIATDLYVDPDLRRRLTAQLEIEGRFQQVRYQLRRRDGRIITVQENARVVRDHDGKVLWYEGTLTDVTPLAAAARSSLS